MSISKGIRRLKWKKEKKFGEKLKKNKIWVFLLNHSQIYENAHKQLFSAKVF